MRDNIDIQYGITCFPFCKKGLIINTLKIILFFSLLLTAPGCASEKTEWTYAFYLVSGKNFFREQNNNYIEMCKGVESIRNGKVIVFIDVEPEKGKTSLLHLKKGTYAFELKSSRKVKQLEIPSIGLLKDKEVHLDSSDPLVLKGFFNYVRKNYSSKRYFYTIIAHGDTFINPMPATINAESISGALEGNKADVLALDMCYMGGLETIWDLRRSASIIAAASTTVPLSVNDYSAFLKNAAASDNTPNETAAAFVSAYKEKYGDNRYPISLFAIDTGAGFENFIGAFNQCASGFLEIPDIFDKIKPKQGAKSNLYGTNTDLITGLNAIDPSLAAILTPAIISTFSINTEFTGPSLFLPKDKDTYEKYRGQYLSTRFSKDNPNWTAFLDLFYKHP